MEKRERRERYRRQQHYKGGGDKQTPSNPAAAPAPAAAAPVVQEKKVIDHTAIPDPHMFDKLKRETEEIAALQPKKYSKRQVFSNWAKYEGGEGGAEEEEERSGETFEVLLRGAQMGSQLQLKSERSWDPKSIASLNAAFAIDMGALAAALACLPLHRKLALPQEAFSNEELERMEARVRSALHSSRLALGAGSEGAGAQPERVFVLGAQPDAQQSQLAFERETQPEDEPPRQPQSKVELQQLPPPLVETPLPLRPEVEPPGPIQPKVEVQQQMQLEMERESEQPCPESAIIAEWSADEVSAAAQTKKKSGRNKKRASGQEASKELGKEGRAERAEKQGNAQAPSAPSKKGEEKKGQGKKEEDHLDFLLSLHKPSSASPHSVASAFAAPTSAQQAAIDREEPPPPAPSAPASAPAQPQGEKAHELEDWLDSMLDD